MWNSLHLQRGDDLGDGDENKNCLKYGRSVNRFLMKQCDALLAEHKPNEIDLCAFWSNNFSVCAVPSSAQFSVCVCVCISAAFDKESNAMLRCCCCW